MSCKDDVKNSSANGSSPTSFVYPVRTLLAGIHSPQGLPPTEGGVSEQNDGQEEGDAAHVVGDTEVTTDDYAGAQVQPHVPPLTASASHRQHKYRSPNFRDFSPEEDVLSPRSFATNHLISIAHSEREPGDQMYTAGPMGEPVEYTADDSLLLSELDDFNPRRPVQVSEAAADAFADYTEASSLAPDVDGSAEADPPSNFSQAGYVHLPPVDSPGTRSLSLGPDSRGRTRHGSGGFSSYESQDDMEQDEESAQRSSMRPYSSDTGSAASLESSGSSDGPRITFRYTHIEDEVGHHLIVGREGDLTKCEDEPIRTPGGVQGFGVLIAIEEDDETGNLVVRQVSENSTELLGLSPNYLFSLDCLTQTLSDSQADLLLDNIQYLSDGAITPEEQAENLHVFLLNGFGEPGSALPEESTRDLHQRRSWVCWVAAHRPQMTAPANLESQSTQSAALEQNIIILEFELERDHFNPLYPPLREDLLGSSGVSSPSDASGSASTDAVNSSSSGRTLVSSESDDQRLTASSTPDSLNPGTHDSDQSLNASVTATSDLDPVSAITSVATTSSSPSQEQEDSSSLQEVSSSDEWLPSPEAILESTTSRSKPLLALERLRRTRRGVEYPASPASSSSSDDRGGSTSRRGGVAARRRRGGGSVGMMDVFSVMAQINEQLGAANDLDTFMQIVVGVIKDLTQFHRVLVYQFDEVWNGKVVAELVDWTKTHDLYKGLHFPATDIPAQARALYALNKVRILYDRGQPTARLVVRSKRDLETPLDMTHCYLRAMSPIHLKYLGNMGVRASMSVSIVAFNKLWGLVACHSYGPHGMRVSFPVRQMLRLLSQSISRNVERLCYAQRLHTRKLINAMPSDQHPSGYIVSDANDLLGLFDADHGVLVIGEGAKILGPNQHGQEILVIAEYLRLKQFNTIQVSQAIVEDYPDLQLSSGLEVIAGLLYIPLSVGGGDFIAFLRKGQPRQVNWAGRPYKPDEPKNSLEPRSSFKIWSETVAGRCRAWTDEHLETAGVLALVYGKFIEVWRQKESALQTTKLTNILLSNASHEVRTPLNHIINYLELALNGHLDTDTRENLSQSHAASKSLLFTINDLLDLTRLESGHETSFNEPFDLYTVVYESTLVYRNEAARRGLQFDIDLSRCPHAVVGDSRKIRTVIANLTANALKYTPKGRISVECQSFEELAGPADSGSVAVEIVVSDTGCGMTPEKLESIFREFEQVEVSPATPPPPSQKGLGLGLAVVARIVEQLGGQLRVDSRVDEGTRFSFLVAFSTDTSSTSPSPQRTRTQSRAHSDIDSFVNALAGHSFNSSSTQQSSQTIRSDGSPAAKPAVLEITEAPVLAKKPSRPKMRHQQSDIIMPSQLRILIVEDNDINRTILSKRLSLDGHDVVNTTNGQEGLDMVEGDREFDAILMDIQMPLLNGYEATERIRALEQDTKTLCDRVSQRLNGRIPIFAVSASLREAQREEMHSLGMDGWILKPIDFKRLRVILRGVTDTSQRAKDVYHPGCSWEHGGWLAQARSSPQHE